MADHGKTSKRFDSMSVLVLTIASQPGHFFDYEMRPDEGYAGTYYYHSHVGFQAVSAGGPIIVEEAEGEASPYNYDDERILFLSEHYNKTDHDIVEGLTSEEFTW
jgi:FtsP/CotA-like multicopper oxidase with cupredoxin domain